MLTHFTCGKCRETKALADFPRRGKDINSKTRTSSCKKCRSAYMVQWKNASPERREYDRRKAKERAARFPLESRKNNLKAKHGITLEHYDMMFAAQGGCCAICSGHDKDIDRRTGKNRRLAVDHCHESGEVRALLCGDCNRALGLVKESPVVLAKMISYLSRFSNLKKQAA